MERERSWSGKRSELPISVTNDQMITKIYIEIVFSLSFSSRFSFFLALFFVSITIDLRTVVHIEFRDSL